MTTLSSLVDPQLLTEAKQLGGHQTTHETINVALKEYIRWRKRLEGTKLFGTIDFYPEFLEEIDKKSRPR
jgi:Bacterial antitoxin of type II TA system, VapB